MDSSVLQEVTALQSTLDLGTGAQVANIIFDRGSDTVGGDGLQSEERQFRDRCG